MKKILMLLCAVMIMSTANAKVVMTESFTQNVGQLNIGPNTSMGSDTSDWWSYSGSSNYIQVAEGTLSYPGYKSTGVGNKAYLYSTGADDFRQFEEINSGNIYAGAIINVKTPKQGTISDYFLCFGDATAANMYARLYSKSVKNDNGEYIGFQLGIAKYSETNTYVRFTDDVYSLNTNYLVVVEYEFVEGDKNDIARLYVNPTKANPVARLECVQDTTNTGGSAAGANAKKDATKISSIDLRQGTNTPKDVYVDEIKVTTSWTELFEEGGEDPSPAISAASSVDFGKVTIDEAAEKTITVKGSYLKGAISVSSSSALVVPAVSSISKDDAESANGYALKLTLTATEAGEGSASITLSSTDAENQVVSVNWEASAPAAETLTIAEVKTKAAEAEVALNDVVIIRVFQDGMYFAVQDETGALNIADYYGVGTSWKVGDKLSGISGIKLPDEEAMDGFCTIFPTAGSVAASGVEVAPFEVTLGTLDQYGPALVSVKSVAFPEDAEKFAAGYITISQGEASVQMQIPAGCDIIGEDVPASADVKGLVCHPYLANNLILSKSADLTNRVPKGGDQPGEDNLILNHSFEEYSSDMFGTSFEEWTFALGTATINTANKLDGAVSMQLYPTSIATTLDQGVALSDADYAAGSKFTLTLNYNILSMPEGSNLALDCYWEAAPGGDSEATKAHESDILRVDLESGSGWLQKVLVTTKPAKSSYFRVRVKVPKNAKVLFDNFSLYYTPSTEPYIEVSPSKLNSVSTTIGNTATFQTIHIRQGNLNGPTKFELSYTDASMFQLSMTGLSADQSEADLVITYAPTGTGTHTAYLNIDNDSHTELHQTIKLEGSCTDPSAKPSISVTPSELPMFEAVVEQSAVQTVTMTSINCTDYVYAHVEHIQGEAFTIDGTMYSKNATAQINITFRPLAEGDYQSTLTLYSEGAESVVVTLNGKGIAKTPETIDWQTDFVWNQDAPLKYMYERFDNVAHNKTLQLTGWQNVAALDARPWWGFDEAKTSPARGEEKYAKATAYQYAKDSTDTWEMILVTPALDYKNAEGKTFTFNVMGEYLQEEENPVEFSIYYIDATGDKVYWQDLTGSFDIPMTSDDNLTWRTFYLDLAPYAETMADVFYMAFGYKGPNGNEGAVTYYIDDVSWGRTDLPEILVTPASIIDSTAVINTKKTIATLNISSRNLENPITLSLEGANYNRFELSATSLPVEGGEVEVSFEGEEIGVHEAYIRISSKGAPDKFVPMAVLCNSSITGVEQAQGNQVRSTKVLRDGRILILRGEKAYTILGSEL